MGTASLPGPNIKDFSHLDANNKLPSSGYNRRLTWSKPEKSSEDHSVGIPSWRYASAQSGAAEQIVAGNAGHFRGHDASRACAAALIAETSAIALESAIGKELLQHRQPVVAPHSGEIAQVRGHAPAIYEEREVSGKKIFPDRPVFKARVFNYRVSKMMSHRVEQKIDVIG